MKQRIWGIAIVLLLMLSACGSTVETKIEPTEPATFANQENPLLDDLRNWLPGYYTDYTQVIEAGRAEDSVTDLTVRLIPAEQETVFLFESQQRGSVAADYVVYFAHLNVKTGQLKLHFSRLTGSELSMSMPETLAIARQRVLPGCVINFTSTGNEFTGGSLAETCHFEDPLHGMTALMRAMTITNSHLQLSNLELNPGEVLDIESQAMDFQKQQAFEGSVSVSTASEADDQDGSDWQKSTNLNIYDDGRINKLYDAEMTPMDYAIRLSRLHWRENEPPYLKLEILHQQSGEALAYSWFKLGSEKIDFESDWVTVHLKELHLGSE